MIPTLIANGSSFLMAVAILVAGWIASKWT
ncbi:MAG: hypothetical protein ACI8PZ_007529 [Myxococcota bacterium]|jgi:hypothetical protein